MTSQQFKQMMDKLESIESLLISIEYNTTE